MLREFDEAVYNFATFHLPDDQGQWKEVPRVFATPDRAFSRWVELNPNTPDGAKRKQDDVTLPLASVSMVGEPELDWSRYSMARNRVAYTNDFNGIFVAPHSDPYTLRYQIDFWAKTKRHLQLLIEQWLRAFNGDITLIRVPILSEGSEYRKLGQKTPIMTCEMYHESVTDNSDLEPGEDQNRILRKTVTARINAWLIKGVTQVPTVRRVNLSLMDTSTGETLSTEMYDEETLVLSGS